MGRTKIQTQKPRITGQASMGKRLTRGIVLVLTTFFVSIPLLWLLISSFKSRSEYTAYPIRFLPSALRWENYSFLLDYPPFAAAIWRTFVLGITVAAITCFTSALAGYGFARYNVPGSSKLFWLVIAWLLIPGIVFWIPQFILFARLKLINTFWPWYLGALGGSPLYIFLFRQFFLNLPKELEEAAEMDGCGPLRTFVEIIFPNTKPIVAIVLIFGFNTVWGDYLMPTLFLNDPTRLLGTWLAPSAITGVEPGFLAATILYILPVTILFLFAQKHLTKGFVITGIKG